MRCTSTRRDGTPCKATARPEMTLCWAHDPELQARAQAARKAGGQNGSNAARAARYLPRELRGLASKLIDAIDEVHTGKLDHKRLTAMAAGASAVVKLYEVGELTIEVQELRERLEGGTQWRA